MQKKRPKESALNLVLEGSIGSFSVGTGIEKQNSIEVKYCLTHFGLDFSISSNEGLLSHLAPVREIFDLNLLDFDEIMQRDIDDARVSSELIPYLLDEKSVDLVKLFPPIVVVVLPVEEGKNSPSKFYSELEEEEKPESDQDYGKYILRSGTVGKEIFQFEQAISDGEKLKHDDVRFRLNTHRTRLVIVDGQHRAMALLALYRNLKDQWSDEKRAPFKEYYSEWTPKYIERFNLKKIDLPVILCTFPSLDKKYSGDFDLIKAARYVFLTLNRNARKVSRTRNILLDDSDIIAYFLRRCLSKIKQKDQRSQFSLRIFNIELDQSDKERLKLESPIAITGVSHLYYIIEHLLLNKGIEEGGGVKARSGNFANRKNLNHLMNRLDGRNLLGSEISESSKRDNFTADVAEQLCKIFQEKYGNLIVEFFEKFAPYENHNKAVLNLEQRIETHKDRQLKPILFEGQGIGRVFDAHRENLKAKITDGEFNKVPEIESIAKRLDATAKRVEKAIEDFRVERTELYLKPLSYKAKLKDSEGNINFEVIKYFNELYDNVFKTVAFQAGLICCFFGEIEKADTKFGNIEEESINIEKSFEEYIDQVNSFFSPKNFSQFKKVFKVFKGEIHIENQKWTIVSINHTFRQVVHRQEMQPNYWTKYKYLILEIWNPSNANLKQIVIEEKEKCREQIFSTLYNINKSEYCKNNYKPKDILNESEFNKIYDQTLSIYNRFLENLNTEQLDEQRMKKATAQVSATNDDGSEYEEV